MNGIFKVDNILKRPNERIFKVDNILKRPDERIFKVDNILKRSDGVHSKWTTF